MMKSILVITRVKRCFRESIFKQNVVSVFFGIPAKHCALPQPLTTELVMLIIAYTNYIIKERRGTEE